MRTLRLGVAIVAILGLLAGGCATVKTAPDVTVAQVRKALDAARFSGAEVKSAYEFASANLYLDQALREQRSGNHNTARRYLAMAYEKANLAYENARKFRKAH